MFGHEPERQRCGEEYRYPRLKALVEIFEAVIDAAAGAPDGPPCSNVTRPNGSVVAFESGSKSLSCVNLTLRGYAKSLA